MSDLPKATRPSRAQKWSPNMKRKKAILLTAGGRTERGECSVNLEAVLLLWWLISLDPKQRAADQEKRRTAEV